MKFGGLQPFTLSDFPGHVAAIAFAQGCNFRCPYCHNGSLLRRETEPGSTLGGDQVIGFLLSRLTKLDGLVVTGGEPTIQEDLPAFLRQVKDLGLAVKLDTNGSHPEMLARIIAQNLADFVAMDVKAPLKKYEQLAGVFVPPGAILQSIHLLAASGVSHEFRTTAVEALLPSQDLACIRGMLPSASTHRIQPFISENARDPMLRTGSPTAKAAVKIAPEAVPEVAPEAVLS